MFTKSISFLCNHQGCTLHSVKHTDMAEHQLSWEPSSQQEGFLSVLGVSAVPIRRTYRTHTAAGPQGRAKHRQ